MPLKETVVSAFIAGDTEAFREIYEATKRSIYSVVFRMTTDPQDTEDIIHDVYVRAFEKRHLYNKTKASLHTWLYQMAVNHTLNCLKRHKRWVRDVIIEDLPEEVQEHQDDTDDTAHALYVLEKVNPDFRACLVLREVEDKSYEEIARLMKLSIGTVRSRISRGREQLKRLFYEHQKR